MAAKHYAGHGINAQIEAYDHQHPVISEVNVSDVSDTGYTVSTRYLQKQAVYLCCTFPEVAFGGRYPLSLPYGARTFLMYGLSAWHTRLSDLVAGLLYFI